MLRESQPTVLSFQPGHFDFSFAGLGNTTARILDSRSAIRVDGLPEAQDAFVPEGRHMASPDSHHLPPFWYRRALDGNAHDTQLHAEAGIGTSASPRIRSSVTVPHPFAMELKVRTPASVCNDFVPSIYLPDHLKNLKGGEKVFTANGEIRAHGLAIGQLPEFKQRLIALATEHQVACRVEDTFDCLFFMAYAQSQNDIDRFCDAVRRGTYRLDATNVIHFDGPSLFDEICDGLGNLWHNMFTRR